MLLYTQRLILRPWSPDDAADLYEYAKDPRVGPIAGWYPHTSVENSRDIIKSVLSAEDIFAVCLKGDGRAIGSIGLMLGSASNLNLLKDEAELGYWIGVPFWGQGLIPEAARELIRYGFEDMGLAKIWCGYFDGNEKSKRVQEKCGFIYHHMDKDIHWEQTDDTRTEHITCLAREQWSAEGGHERESFERVAELLLLLDGKDNNEAFSALKELEGISDRSSVLYPYTDRFAAMTTSDRYVVRVRGFRLFCRQAKWDVDNKLDENIDRVLTVLCDSKPTAVRQALAALYHVVRYKPELRETVLGAAGKIDYFKYDETMHSLIYKDIRELFAAVN